MTDEVDFGQGTATTVTSTPAVNETKGKPSKQKFEKDGEEDGRQEATYLIFLVSSDNPDSPQRIGKINARGARIARQKFWAQNSDICAGNKIVAISEKFWQAKSYEPENVVTRYKEI